MQVTGPSPARFTFDRSGGAAISGSVALWAPTPVTAAAPASQSSWRFAGQALFQNLSLPHEVQDIPLAPGDYLAILQVEVEESLNGRYTFGLGAMGHALFADNGNVDTTSASNDSMSFKDRFVVTIV